MIDSASIIGTSVACAVLPFLQFSSGRGPLATMHPDILGGLIPIFFHLTNQNDEPTFIGT